MTEDLWEVDRRDTVGIGSERYDYFVILNDDGQIVCDTLNSEITVIATETDRGQPICWDSQGKENMERLVACRNAMVGVKDPIAMMKAVADLIAEYNAMKIVLGPAPNEIGRLMDLIESLRVDVQ